MALAEATNCRMAAAGTSSPRQVVRAEPASGPVGSPCAATAPLPELPSCPSAKHALRKAAGCRAQRSLCQLRYPAAQSHRDKRGGTAPAQPAAVGRLPRTWRPRDIRVRAARGLLARQGGGRARPPGTGHSTGAQWAARPGRGGTAAGAARLYTFSVFICMKSVGSAAEFHTEPPGAARACQQRGGCCEQQALLESPTTELWFLGPTAALKRKKNRAAVY